MRDKRFVAGHRGGPLEKGQHLQLMDWACACAEHVLYLCQPGLDEYLKHARINLHEKINGSLTSLLLPV